MDGNGNTVGVSVRSLRVVVQSLRDRSTPCRLLLACVNDMEDGKEEASTTRKDCTRKDSSVPRVEEALSSLRVEEACVEARMEEACLEARVEALSSSRMERMEKACLEACVEAYSVSVLLCVDSSVSVLAASSSSSSS